MSGLGEGLPRTAGAIWRGALPVWAGLMLLLAATLGGAFLPLGPYNLVLALLIAAAKGTLVALFFMQLRRPDPLLRLAAAASLVFIAFMGMLVFSDVLMRDPATQPGRVVPRTLPDDPPSSGARMFR